MSAINWVRAVSRNGLERLDTVEIGLVQAIVNASRTPFLNGIRRFLTHCGNGWLYLALALFVPQWRAAMAVGLVALLIAFLPYLLIKLALARPRPCRRDPGLDCGVRSLDEFSCPSGHCAAAVTFGLPLAYAVPETTVAVVLVISLISWARIAVGHHYLSDLIFGLLLGASVALPLSTMMLR